MPDKEATARIKINKLLEAAGWRFFQDGNAPANIRLEPGVTIKSTDLNAHGDDFETSSKGFVDFLLLDARGFPLLVLEAKAEDKNPLVGKEQARKYARSQNCRFVILSNGNLHYFWDLERGNPYVITSFPTPDSVTGYQKITPNPQRLIEDSVGEDYIVRTQRPNYQSETGWRNEAERPAYIQANKLRFLRPYQLKAIHCLQAAVGDGKDRFLFEMATGTGKTLTAAAVIKLFLRSGNVRRVLFLVDRLELEDQAKKAFAAVLSADYQTVIYKENRDDWRRAEIVVTTVQSLLFNNKYQKLFSPTDFDLVVSDEAHRSIGGNARAVFDYFVGYKLGLTATPREYLRRFDSAKPGIRDPREAERRLLLDTYRTFRCENSQPTFRYSLLDGVKEGFLINPTVVDARTEVTTQLLSEEGFVVTVTDDTGEDQQEADDQRKFEKRFFAEATNQLLCKAFLENALRDPVSGEIGKSSDFFIADWLRNRNTVEFLGIWESVHNPDFNYGEFATIKSQAGLNSYRISVKDWVAKTHARGLRAATGRYGGTYAHKDIAFEFGMWISAEFKVYLIKEFQRLKDEENERLNLGWNLQRTLSKINYRIHTDAIRETLIPPAISKLQRVIGAVVVACWLSTSTSIWLHPKSRFLYSTAPLQ